MITVKDPVIAVVGSNEIVMHGTIITSKRTYTVTRNGKITWTYGSSSQEEAGSYC